MTKSELEGGGFGREDESCEWLAMFTVLLRDAVRGSCPDKGAL